MVVRFDISWLLNRIVAGRMQSSHKAIAAEESYGVQDMHFALAAQSFGSRSVRRNGSIITIQKPGSKKLNIKYEKRVDGNFSFCAGFFSSIAGYAAESTMGNN